VSRQPLIYEKGFGSDGEAELELFQVGLIFRIWDTRVGGGVTTEPGSDR
jgi:hypothetical protein